MLLVETKKQENRYEGVEPGVAPGGWCCHCWCSAIGPMMAIDEEELLD